MGRTLPSHPRSSSSPIRLCSSIVQYIYIFHICSVTARVLCQFPHLLRESALSPASLAMGAESHSACSFPNFWLSAVLLPIFVLFLYQGGFLLFFNFGKLFSFYKISFHLLLPLCFSSVFLALPKKVSIAISLVDCFLAASFNKCPRRSSTSFVFRLDAQEICTN